MKYKNRIAIALALAGFAVGCATKKSPVKAIDTPMTQMDSVSYAFGLLNGQSFSAYMNSIDSSMVKDKILKGFEDALSGATDSMYKANAEYFQNWAKDKEAKKIEALKEASQKVLDETKAKEGVKETKSGLLYSIIRDAEGEKPTVQDTVVVDYEGRLADGTVFDSSYQRGETAEFPLLSVIPGWTEGICLMPVGSKFQFVIPYSLAYGEKGAGNVIPPYSTLIFDVELKGIKRYQEKAQDNIETSKEQTKKRKK